MEVIGVDKQDIMRARPYNNLGGKLFWSNVVFERILRHCAYCPLL